MLPKREVSLLLIGVFAVSALAKKQSQLKEKSDLTDGVVIGIEPDNFKDKRETPEKSGPQSFLAAAGGQYVLKAPGGKEGPIAFNNEYLSLLRQFDNGQLDAQVLPNNDYLSTQSKQQYRAPIKTLAENQDQTDAGLLFGQQFPHRIPAVSQSQQSFPQTFPSGRIPFLFQQQTKNSNAAPLNIYAGQGLSNYAGNNFQEAEVQASFSASQEKPTQAKQPSYDFIFKQQLQPLSQSFDNELLELLAGNQQYENKLKAQGQTPKIFIQAIPQKQGISNAKYPKYALSRPTTQSVNFAAQSASKPQQYLIETTRPVQQNNKPINFKPRYQYVTLPNDPSKLVAYKQTQEKQSAVKIVDAPQFQLSGQQPQYKPSSVPAYFQNYQSIQPQIQQAFSPSTNLNQQSAVNVPAEKPYQQISYQQFPNYFQLQNEQSPQPTKVKEQANIIRYSPQGLSASNDYSANEELFQAFIKQQSLPQQSYPYVFSDKGKDVSSETNTKTYNPVVSQTVFIPKTESHEKSQPKPEVDDFGASGLLSHQERLATLPPPKNNRYYTQEEFRALVAAGYSVTPIPVNDVDNEEVKIPQQNQPQLQHTLPQTTVTSTKFGNFAAFKTSSTTESSTSDETQSYPKETTPVASSSRPVRRPYRRYPFRYTRPEVVQSESRTEATYSSPEDGFQETSNYGMKRGVKSREPATEE